jgi:hypothetical protein
VNPDHFGFFLKDSASKFQCDCSPMSDHGELRNWIRGHSQVGASDDPSGMLPALLQHCTQLPSKYRFEIEKKMSRSLPR